MIRECRKGQGSLEYLLLIGGSVVVAVIVIFIVLSLPQSAGNVAQTGIEGYREVVGVKVTANPAAEGGGTYGATRPVSFSAKPSQGSGDYTCAWTFSDGGTATGCDTVVHSYRTGGTQTATVTVTDNGTGDVSLPKTITVTVISAVANITNLPSDVNLFDAGITAGDPATLNDTFLALDCSGSEPAGRDITCTWWVIKKPLADTGNFSSIAGEFVGGIRIGTPSSPVSYKLDNNVLGTYNIALVVTDNETGAAARIFKSVTTHFTWTPGVGTQIIPGGDGDAAYSWSALRGGYNPPSVNHVYMLQGTGALDLGKTNTTEIGGWYGGLTNPSTVTFDLTNKNVYVWMYVKDKSKLASAAMYVGPGTEYYCIKGYGTSQLSNGWNRLGGKINFGPTVPPTDISCVAVPQAQTTALKAMRLFFWTPTIGDTVPPGEVKMDAWHTVPNT